MTETHRSEQPYLHGYEAWTREWMAKRTAKRELAFLVPHLRTGMNVIDCGCGPGSITIGVAELVAPGQVVGIDIEPRQVKAAQAHAAEKGVSNLRFQSGSITALPFPDASFDVAVAHFVIEHLRDPMPALREMRRVLKPGGVAAIKDPYYPAFTFRPRLPELERVEELLAKVRARMGASSAYAADLRARLLEAGFARTQAEAGTETPAGGPGQQFLPFVLQNQIREQAFRQAVLAEGWASEAELDALAGAVGALGERPDLFGFVVYVQALGWVSA